MAAVTFCTKKSKKGEASTIYVRYSRGRGNDQNVSTGLNIYPEFWSSKTGAIKQAPLFTKKFTEDDSRKLRAKLDDIKDLIVNEANAIAGQQLPPKWLKSVVKQYNDSQAPKQPEQKAETLNEYLTRFLKEAKEGKPLCEGKRSFSKDSLRPWVGFQQVFDKYQRERNRSINWNEVNRDFYEDFIQWLVDDGKTLNYTGRLIKQLKNIMQRGRDEGRHNSDEINKKYFKSMAEDVDSIYLTHDDIEQIAAVNLSAWIEQSQIRDVFLVGCYIGQRYSDYSRISPDNIKVMGGGKVIELIQKKTNAKVVIPITPECDAILKQYEYKLPKTLVGNLNEGIRAIGQMAGLNEIITTTRTEGGMRI
ncbi:MAG TPA: phage integrase SAM-like domain-containing protein, partial [Bacteroidales bacterium]|nr:phage integrase SAM-like domain-containing protein [Bacteroidales bacterium]